MKDRYLKKKNNAAALTKLTCYGVLEEMKAAILKEARELSAEEQISLLQCWFNQEECA